MSNAIKSSATSAIAPQGTTAAQPVDWLSRQGSEGQGGNAGSFARWMAQHNPQTQAPIPQASQASPTAQAARATTANAARALGPLGVLVNNASLFERDDQRQHDRRHRCDAGDRAKRHPGEPRRVCDHRSQQGERQPV